jgi:hypothetical protein
MRAGEVAGGLLRVDACIDIVGRHRIGADVGRRVCTGGNEQRWNDK